MPSADRRSGCVRGLVVVYFGVTFVQVWLASRRDQARPRAGHRRARRRAVRRPAVGGARGPARPRRRPLPARLAPVIVVTGGRQPGDRFTEATASADYLHTQGVPDSAILREVTGRSSWQSLAAAARSSSERDRRVLLVSDPFHSLASAAWPASSASTRLRVADPHQPASTGSTGPSYIGDETVAVGLGRIFGFRRRSVRRRAASSPGAAGAGRAANLTLRPFGGGVIGNTAGSGPVIGGSSPPPRARAR